MKRLLWVGILAFVIGSICACTRQSDESQTDQTEEPVATATATPVVSYNDAFQAAEAMVKEMTLEEKIGQMFLVDLHQLDTDRSLDGSIRKVTDKMKETIQKYNIGGVYLMKENIQNTKQAQRLIQDLQSSAVTGGALYVAVEEDGGGEYSISTKVADLTDTGYATPSEMGENMTANQVYEAGQTIAEELIPLGINLNLSPVADIGDEANPSYAMRCLGTDADTVSSLLDDFVTGMTDGGLSVTLSSFPGIGSVSGDTTEDILESDDSLMTLRNTNFTTYSSGIEAGADCVMMSNVVYTKIDTSKVPAFMSQDIVTKLLREELKFEGIIMTCPLDDNVITNNYTNEFAVVEAVKAGCDLILLPDDLEESYEALLEAVREGKIDEKVINTSVRRILQNKIQRGILEIE